MTGSNWFAALALLRLMAVSADAQTRTESPAPTAPESSLENKETAKTQAKVAEVRALGKIAAEARQKLLATRAALRAKARH
jgi:hypothetical protein